MNSIGRIVRKLRTLLRKRELQFEHVDVNALTSSVLALVLPDAVRRNVVIRTALDPALPKVPADPVHLQQVLLNLLICSASNSCIRLLSRQMVSKPCMSFPRPTRRMVRMHLLSGW